MNYFATFTGQYLVYYNSVPLGSPDAPGRVRTTEEVVAQPQGTELVEEPEKPPKESFTFTPAKMGRPRKYSDEDVAQWVQQRVAGISLKEIASEAGICHSTVITALKAYKDVIDASKVKPRKPKKPRGEYNQYSDEDVLNWVHLRRSGKTWREMVEETGFSLNLMRGVLEATYPEVIAATAKLNMKQQEYFASDFPDLLKFRAEGRSVLAIARYYGVSYSTIRKFIDPATDPYKEWERKQMVIQPEDAPEAPCQVQPVEEVECEPVVEALPEVAVSLQEKPKKTEVDTFNEKAKELVAEGHTIRQIAEAFGIKYHTAKRRLKVAGLEPKKERAKSVYQEVVSSEEAKKWLKVLALQKESWQCSKVDAAEKKKRLKSIEADIRFYESML